MSPAGTATVRVRYAETDQQGVAYHANFLVWMEIGRTGLLRALGYPYEDLEEAGVYFAVAEARCRYLGAARYEEEVTIVTRCEKVRSRSVVFEYDLSVDGRRIATGETTLIALDERRRPRRIPEPVAVALEPRVGAD